MRPQLQEFGSAPEAGLASSGVQSLSPGPARMNWEHLSDPQPSTIALVLKGLEWVRGWLSANFPPLVVERPPHL